MKRLLVTLPALAVLLAAAVASAELGTALNASPAPATLLPEEASYAVADETSVAEWVETGRLRQDTRKARLPQPRVVTRRR